jgi:hypothetical protein
VSTRSREESSLPDSGTVAKAAMNEGYAWLGGFAELHDVTWVDLPTSHWPMWARPRELAAIIGDVAKARRPGVR